MPNDHDLLVAIQRSLQILHQKANVIMIAAG